VINAGEVGGHVRGAEDPELGQGRRLVRESHFLAVATDCGSLRQTAPLPGLREQADVVGTTREAPTQGQNVSTLPVSPS